MKINIKGTNYKVDFVDVVCEDDNSVVGYTSYDDKLIKLQKNANLEDMCENISHELYHAFMYVCGLDDYCFDETLVHFLGRQYINMLFCFLDILSYRYPKYKNIIKKLKKMLV